MQKEIRVWETTETVTILAGSDEGTYRVIWHRTEGPQVEFQVTPDQNETVEAAVARDLRNRLGP